MGRIEHAWAGSLSRRNAFRALAGFLAGSPLLRSQQDPFHDHSRVPSLEEMVTAFDFEPVAYARMLRQNYDFMGHGADSEFTLRRNRQAFDWAELIPHGVASGGSISRSINTEVDFFGTKMPFPIMVAPSSFQSQLHPDGELAMHVGSTDANAKMLVSNASSFPIDKIGAAAKGPLWFQLYPKQDLDDNRSALEAAQTAGCTGVVVTVDVQAVSYERDLHDRHLSGSGAATPRRTGRAAARAPRNPYGAPEGRMWYEWKLFDQIRPIIKGPHAGQGHIDARRRPHLY